MKGLAIESAFTIFGQVAGRELFTNPEVAKGLSGLEQYFDEKAIKKALSEIPAPIRRKVKRHEERLKDRTAEQVSVLTIYA